MKRLLEIFDAFIERYNLGAWWLLIFFAVVIAAKVIHALVQRLA